MPSSIESQAWIAYRPIYEQLLTHCPPLQFQAPWDFLQAQPHCRGPVANPTAVLADLRERYDDVTLKAARVLSDSGEEDPHLSPLFADPDTALIALRDSRDGTLQGLLTSRGCLPRSKLSLDLMLQDQWTQEVFMVKGVLFATPDIREVALLQALGLPATLSLDLHRLPLSWLAKLNAMFEENLSHHSDSARTTLALVGWSLLSLDAQPSPVLAPAVKHLSQARNYLNMDLSGVGTWRLRADELENLRFRLKFRRAGIVQELLLDSAGNLEDLATLLPPGATSEADAESGRAYAAAQANLLAQLAAAPMAGPLPECAQRAREIYEKLVQRELIGPLLDWALSRKDAVLRNAGVQLTTVCHMLHQMSPLLLSQQTRQLGCALATGSEPLPTKALSQYLALTTRLGSLLRDLSQWRNA